jgi:trypsin
MMKFLSLAILTSLCYEAAARYSETRHKPIPSKPGQMDKFGSKEERIVNGEEVDPPGKYPFMVNGGSCGASLIAPNLLLSAAHCAGYITKVNIGAHNVTNNSEDRESFFIKRYVTHPKYNYPKYDFMVLEIDGVSGYSPIELDNGTTVLSEGEDLIVMGWGLTSTGGVMSDVLLEVELDAMTNEDCNSLYSGVITDEMICATRTINGITYDSCQGDSGGPIISKADGRQIGVVLWGDDCADPNFPGVYARVSSVIDWINVYIADWYNPCTSDDQCIPKSDCLVGTCNSSVCAYKVGNGVEYDLEIFTDDYPTDLSWMIFDYLTQQKFPL